MGTLLKPSEHQPEQNDDLDLNLGLARCPFCHDDVAVERETWVACSGCLARHHDACWAEGARCASCGGAEHLSAQSEQQELTPLRAMWFLIKRGLKPVLKIPMVVLAALLQLLWWPISKAWRGADRMGTGKKLLALALMGGLLAMGLIVGSETTGTRYVTNTRVEYRTPPTPSLSSQARTHYAEGNYVRATDAYTRLLRKDPTSILHRRNRAWSYMALGRFSKAASDFELATGEIGLGVPLLALVQGDLKDATTGLKKAAPTWFFANLFLSILEPEWDHVGTPKNSWERSLAEFAKGELSELDLVTLAGRGSGKDRLRRLCEANTYAALRHDLAGERELAIPLYEAAVNTGIGDYIEMAVALNRLRRLESGGRCLGPAEAAEVAPEAPAEEVDAEVDAEVDEDR
jgi:hypothetical protein